MNVLLGGAAGGGYSQVIPMEEVGWNIKLNRLKNQKLRRNKKDVIFVVSHAWDKDKTWVLDGDGIYGLYDNDDDDND